MFPDSTVQQVQDFDPKVLWGGDTPPKFDPKPKNLEEMIDRCEDKYFKKFVQQNHHKLS